MILAFRADSSVMIGTGHVMRCLTLADWLASRGAKCYFISRELPGNSFVLIRNRGHGLLALPPLPLSTVTGANGGYSLEAGVLGDARETIVALRDASVTPDWLVADHYGIGAEWETFLRGDVKKLFAIDDLADRLHDVDLLLDAGPAKGRDSAYIKLAPGAQCLLGPAFALLREEFRTLRAVARQRRAARTGVGRIVVSFGGVDKSNQTAKALRAIQRLADPRLVVDIVLGSANPHQQSILEECTKMKNVNTHVQATNLAELMLNADLAIGSGGTTTFERCVLGLPSITLETVANQRANLEGMSRLGAVLHLGPAPQVEEESLSAAVEQLTRNPAALKAMAKSCFECVDGEGVERIERSLRASS